MHPPSFILRTCFVNLRRAPQRHTRLELSFLSDSSGDLSTYLDGSMKGSLRRAVRKSAMALIHQIARLVRVVLRWAAPRIWNIRGGGNKMLKDSMKIYRLVAPLIRLDIYALWLRFECHRLVVVGGMVLL
jgi:hypothetical protein